MIEALIVTHPSVDAVTIANFLSSLPRLLRLPPDSLVILTGTCPPCPKRPRGLEMGP